MAATALEEKQERRLLRLARKGNCEAYEELIGYYGPALKGWIRKYCRGNDDLAEEIYSITIIKCWSKIKKFKGNSKFSTWANAIARNAFLDEFRKKKKCKLIDIENVAFLASSSQESEDLKKSLEKPIPEYDSVDNDLPSARIENQEKRDQAKKISTKVLNKLSKDHREILELRDMHGLEYSEIASTLKIRLGTVMSRLYYARRNAKKILLRIEKR
tara:strand:+ start:123 stop:770 length:648 start_codon:yes stop_codon:yes gene_type:complete